jgi:uncharacterized protein YndB with AHSA1/START domain
MSDRVDINRSIELDLEPAAVWELIGDGERWPDWMVDAADVDVVAGGGGRVRDGDERRDVRIDTVTEGERIAFEWWPVDRPDEASAVDLRIVPSTHGAVLEVVETFPVRRSATAMSADASRWRARAECLLASRRLLIAA